jgi:hypothetical protein
MKQLKKAAGIIWMLAAPAAMFYLIKTAALQIELKPEIDTKIQWGVFIVTFLPIAVGLAIFGWYAFKGEYES